MGATWPTKRPDGTLAVAARFAVDQPDGREALERYADGWPETHPDTHGLALAELTVAPHVVASSNDRLDVIFDAKPGSRHWKGVMVAFVHDVPSEGVHLEGFADLVGGVFRPHTSGQVTEP